MRSLGECKTCGGKVSRRAQICPHCGEPTPFQYDERDLEDLAAEAQNAGFLATVLMDLRPELGLDDALKEAQRLIRSGKK